MQKCLVKIKRFLCERRFHRCRKLCITVMYKLYQMAEHDVFAHENLPKNVPKMYGKCMATRIVAAYDSL